MKIRIDTPGISYSSTVIIGGVSKTIVCKDGIVDTLDVALQEHLLTTQVGSEIVETKQQESIVIKKPVEVKAEVEKPKPENKKAKKNKE